MIFCVIPVAASASCFRVSYAVVFSPVRKLMEALMNYYHRGLLENDRCGVRTYIHAWIYALRANNVERTSHISLIPS